MTKAAFALFALAAAVSGATAVDVTSADVTDYASLIAGVFTPGSAGANALGDALQFNFGDIGDGDGGTSSNVADDLAVKPITLGTLSDFSPDFVADFAKTAARAVKAAPLGALGGDIKQLLDDATRAGAKLAHFLARGGLA